EFKESLVQGICGGLHPKFAKETPDVYVELASQCMNAVASKRPSANGFMHANTRALYKYFQRS
ncbi:30284_t:CDS:1, partial [Racocetra persica]